MWINPAGSLTGDLHTMRVKGVIWSIHRDCFLDFLSNSTKLFAIGKWDKVSIKHTPLLWIIFIIQRLRDFLFLYLKS